MPVTATTDDDFQTILHENENVIVKYYADWCGSCRLFSPKFRRLSDDERFSEIKFLEIDTESNPQAREMGNVDNLPFFAIFKNGVLLHGSATAKEETVVAMLSEVQP
ncbi:MAG: thioredoxin family protein [Ignavibacteria bacterium]|nr:thioredoxin family protein [Ignavibacteria bacterium]